MVCGSMTVMVWQVSDMKVERGERLSKEEESVLLARSATLVLCSTCMIATERN